MRISLPPEFVDTGRGVLVRRGFEAEAVDWLGAGAVAAPDALDAADAADAVEAHDARPHAGRGGARAIRLRDGGRAWRRPYRHGGLLRDLLGDVYWQRPPRPWRELVATEAARRSGVIAPEVLAASARPLAAPLCFLHRAVLVTRDLPQRRSLAEALRSAATAAERRDWIGRAWEAIARLHAAGIQHRDLNATNLLVAGPDDPVAVIDFDRAVVGLRPVGALGRAFARRRLARSVAKLGLPELDRRAVRTLLAAPVPRDATASRAMRRGTP